MSKKQKQLTLYDAIGFGMTYKAQPPQIIVRLKPNRVREQKLEKIKISNSSFPPVFGLRSSKALSKKIKLISVYLL